MYYHAASLPPRSSLRSRPAADYEPWATALPYIYKLERLLNCSTGEGLVAPFLGLDGGLLQNLWEQQEQQALPSMYKLGRLLNCSTGEGTCLFLCWPGCGNAVWTRWE